MPVTQRPDKLESYDLWLNCGLSCATIIVWTLAYLTLCHPLQAEAQARRQEIRQLQEIIQRTSEIAKQHKTLTAQLDTSKKSAAELMQRIPAAPRESDFLTQICQLANRTGLEVADYHPGVIEKRENHHEKEVKVNASGEYEPLCKFLELIDHLPRLCRLTRLEIGTEEMGSKLRIEMIFRIYFSPTSEDQPGKAG